ncbi:MAG TPA: cell division protein ZapA [Usitatibacter sp.]|nr:cell division protein ZapA [Usitatibacter sp.]
MNAEATRDAKGALTINLLGREFRVACPEGEERSLLASVEYVNRKMKEIRDTGKVVGNERVALLAALNIAHEFLSNPGKSSGAGVDAAAIRRRMEAMQETLDSALAADQENLF